MNRGTIIIPVAVLAILLAAGCATSTIKPNTMADDPGAQAAAKTANDTAVKTDGVRAETVKVAAAPVAEKKSVRKPAASRPKPKRHPIAREQAKVMTVDTLAAALAMAEKEKTENAKRRTSTLMLLSLGVISVPLVGFAAFKIFGLGAASGGPPVGPPRAPPPA